MSLSQLDTYDVQVNGDVVLTVTNMVGSYDPPPPITLTRDEVAGMASASAVAAGRVPLHGPMA